MINQHRTHQPLMQSEAQRFVIRELLIERKAKAGPKLPGFIEIFCWKIDED
jgi:hypothetical protein